MELSILGSVEARADGRVLDLGGARPRALLAALALNAGRPVTAERLAVALWGDDTPANGLKTLQVNVSRLRRALEDPGRIATSRGGYSLRVDPQDVDALRFEHLVERARERLDAGEPGDAAAIVREALALWRGPPLADVAAAPFAAAEIRRLEDAHAAALELRIDADLQLGRHAALLPELRALTSAHPWRERLHAHLMLALYRSGRPADALQAYRDAREALADQLGIEPGPELRRLEGEILRHEPSLDLGPSPSAAARPGVAVPPTPTIGRERDIAAASALLREERTRLVTLTGPGGVGKTRVAVEVARGMAGELPGGARLVTLAGTARAEHVPAAIAQALGVVPGAAETFDAALARELAPEQGLLVLDNFEQVIDAAPALAALLTRAPGIRMLVTSRRPLRLTGEHVLGVEPLPPADASALFLERAAAAGHAAGRETAEDAAAVRELCARLDGLPLAIELAAARAGVLSPRSLLGRLEDRLDVLGPGARDAPHRQRTLESTIAWSYDLLAGEERRMLDRLSVFAGGCAVDAAEAVSGDRDTVQRLGALVDHSLLTTAAGPDGELRFALLDTIRAYAAARLARSGEADEVRRRHAEHYTALAERLEPDVSSARDAAALDRFEADHENVRAALDWCVAAGRDDLALRLVGAVYLFWRFRGHHEETEARLEAALAMSRDPSPARAKVLRCAAVANAFRGRHDAALAAADELLAIAEATEDPVTRAHLLDAVAFAASQRGDLARSRELQEEMAALSRAAGAPLQLCMALTGLSDAALRDGRFEDAVELAEESVVVARGDGNLERLSVGLGNLGSALLELGRSGDAARSFAESLELSRRLGIGSGVAYALEGLAAVAAARARHETAVRLEGAVGAELERDGTHLQTYENDRSEAVLAAARSALGADAFAAALADGRRLSLDDVTALAGEVTGAMADGG